MQNNHPGIDLAELDAILGPVLASSNGSAEPRVLALLVKGISREVHDEAIRLWVLSRCVDGYMFGNASDAIGGRHDPNEHRGHSRSRRSRDIAYEMRSIAKSPERWARLLVSARERVLSSSGDGRDVRGESLDIALRLVAGVLMQMPEAMKPSGSRSKRTDDKPAPKPRIEKSSVARAALMTMGLRMLSEEKVWDTVKASQPWFAAELGLDVQVVARALDLLEERGLVTRTVRKAYVTTRTHVVALGKRKKVARVWSDVAAKLLDGEGDPVSAVLRAVTHPAWTYSDKLKARHWLMLLADVAGVEPSTLGITAAMSVTLRGDLVKTGYDWSPAVMVPYLDEILDRLADDIEYGTTDKETGERITARVAKARAMDAWREQAAVRKVAAETARQMKKAGYAALDALLELHPIPKNPFGRKASALDKRWADVHLWVESLHPIILSDASAEKGREIVGRLLHKRLIKDWGGRDYVEKVRVFADDIVPYIMEAGGEVTLEEWMSQASADDVPSTPSRRRG